MTPTLPLTDEALLRQALEQINLYGSVTGRDLRDRYWLSHAEYLHPMSLPSAVSWTAALRRWERRGELRSVELVGPRGGNAGLGYVLPDRRPRPRVVK